MESTLLLNNQAELDAVYREPTVSVRDLFQIGDELLQIKIKKKQGFEKINRKGNTVIGSFITAHSRMVMMDAINKILKSGQIPLYTDTDSIILARKKDSDLQIPIDDQCFGMFKHEYNTGDIKYFYSMG